MHVRGFKGTYDDEGMPVYAPPSTEFPTIGTEWTGVLQTAIQTWGAVTASENQAKAQIATAPYQYRYGTPYMPGYGGTMPAYGYAPGAQGGLFGFSWNAVILTGAALGAIAIFSKGKRA